MWPAIVGRSLSADLRKCEAERRYAEQAVAKIQMHKMCHCENPIMRNERITNATNNLKFTKKNAHRQIAFMVLLLTNGVYELSSVKTYLQAAD